jgi:hypothetical protein
MSITTGTFPGVRIVDMPDLGTVTDTSSVVGEHAGSGRFSALALRNYATVQVNDALATETAARAAGHLPTIAALRANAIVAPPLAKSVYVAGYRATADGGEGVFAFAPGDTTTADNGGTFIVDALGQRWRREGPLTIHSWGAVGDGITDDTAAIQKAFDWVGQRGAPLGPTTGVYAVSAPLVLLPAVAADPALFRAGPEVALGQRAYFKATAAMAQMLTLGGNASDNSQIIRHWGLSLGTWDCALLAQNGITVANATGCIIRGTKVRNFLAHGFELGSAGSPQHSYEIYLENCFTDRNPTSANPANSVAVFYNNCSDSGITDCVFTGARVGISANASGTASAWGVYDAKFVNVHIWNAAEQGELLYGFDLWANCHCIGCQVDTPFQYAWHFRELNNSLVSCQTLYGSYASVPAHAYIILVETGGGGITTNCTWVGSDATNKVVAEATGDLSKYHSFNNTPTNVVTFGARGPTIVKAFAYITSPGTIVGANEVILANRNGAGDYTITLTNSLSASAAIQVTPASAAGTPIIAYEQAGARGPLVFRVLFQNLAGTFVDPAAFSVQVTQNPTATY